MHFHERKFASFLKTVFTMALCGIVALAPVGCAKYYVPTAGQPTSLGSIGIVSAKFVPEVDIDMPDTGLKGQAISRWEGLKGSGKKGVSAGAKGGFIVGSPCALGLFAPLVAPFAIACILATTLSGTILGGVGGGIYGVATGSEDIPSEEDVAQVKNVIHQLIAALHMQEAQREEVLAVARERTTHVLIENDELGPTYKEEDISYESLHKNGVDTVLELSVLSLGMQGKTGVDPALIFTLTVAGRLVRVQDGFMLKNKTFNHRSEPHVYSLWGANGGEVFQRELEAAYQELGSQITTQFLQMPIR